MTDRDVAILNTEIHNVGLSSRAVNAFCRNYRYYFACGSNDLITVNDLYRAYTNQRKSKIREWRNIGPKVLEEYRIVLKELELI